ncbi:MAG TPA: hypothetical protein VJ867_02665 [Gemmatimonadaceae bacterium]|nr:hypothetical protein [Gemmatimonadaceae bacterium]
MSAIERDVLMLKRYAVVSSVLLIVASVAAFRRGEPQKARFTEIDVERINVVEPDGKYRLVISNRPRSIGPIYKGKPFGYAGGGRPGLIFFNDEGSENGGLTFEGSTDSLGHYSASTHMSFDQFNSDQVLNLDYQDTNGRRYTGISVEDRADVNIYDWVQQRDSLRATFPNDTARQGAALRAWVAARANGVPLYVRRMFVGRDVNRAAMLTLFDPRGKPRLRLVVDSLGAPRIDFLDGSGTVTNSLNGAR